MSDFNVETINLMKKIEESNKIFDGATKSEKIIMIAKDCIERLKVRNFIAQTGALVRVDSWSIDYDYSDSFKDIINLPQYVCSVCAKGALLCSYVGRVNEVLVGEVVKTLDANDIDNKQHQKLLELFTPEQLDLIEIAFEGTSYLQVVSYEDFDKAKKFNDKFSELTNNECLTAICKNIIKNKGVFKP